jgi:hypothetical protein
VGTGHRCRAFSTTARAMPINGRDSGAFEEGRLWAVVMGLEPVLAGCVRVGEAAFRSYIRRVSACQLCCGLRSRGDASLAQEIIIQSEPKPSCPQMKRECTLYSRYSPLNEITVRDSPAPRLITGTNIPKSTHAARPSRFSPWVTAHSCGSQSLSLKI